MSTSDSIGYISVDTADYDRQNLSSDHRQQLQIEITVNSDIEATTIISPTTEAHGGTSPVLINSSKSAKSTTSRHNDPKTVASLLQTQLGQQRAMLRRTSNVISNSGNDYFAELKILLETKRFWLFVSVLSLSEPIVIAYYPTGAAGILAQTLILSFLTACFAIQVLVEYVARTNRPSPPSVLLDNFAQISFLVKYILHIYDFIRFLYKRGDYLFELISFLIGWIFLFRHPGIAALRCFRVFRLLWYPDIEVIHDWTLTRRGYLFGGTLTVIVRACRFAVSSLIALGREMFTLSKATHGGFLIGFMFFYTAFVMGMALYIETGQSLSACSSLGGCVFTMIRLTLYDGNGFDYAYQLSHSHRFLFVVVMCYLCVTSFGMLNGLVGIFGSAFTDSRDSVYNLRKMGGITDEGEFRRRSRGPSNRNSNQGKGLSKEGENFIGSRSGSGDEYYNHNDQDDDLSISSTASASPERRAPPGSMFTRNSRAFASDLPVLQLVRQIDTLNRTNDSLLRKLNRMEHEMKVMKKDIKSGGVRTSSSTGSRSKSSRASIAQPHTPRPSFAKLYGAAKPILQRRQSPELQQHSPAVDEEDRQQQQLPQHQSLQLGHVYNGVFSGEAAPADEEAAEMVSSNDPGNNISFSPISYDGDSQDGISARQLELVEFSFHKQITSRLHHTNTNNTNDNSNPSNNSNELSISQDLSDNPIADSLRFSEFFSPSMSQRLSVESRYQRSSADMTSPSNNSEGTEATMNEISASAMHIISSESNLKL